MVFVYTAPRVLIAERVAPRYDTSLSILYNVRRVLLPGTEFRLITNSDVYGVYVDSDDLIASAPETVLEPGFDTSKVKDHDDDTYSKPVTDLGAGETRDHAVWDLGSVAARILYAKLYGYYTTTITEVVVSSDGATWVTAAQCYGGLCTRVYYGSFRYVKIRSINTGTSPASYLNYSFYTVEAYPANLRKTLVVAAEVYTNVRVFSRYSSQLLEFMRLT